MNFGTKPTPRFLRLPGELVGYFMGVFLFKCNTLFGSGPGMKTLRLKSQGAVGKVLKSTAIRS